MGKTHAFILVALVATPLLAACSSTPVNFNGPPGTVLMVNDKPYHLPAQVELQRPGSAGDSYDYNVSLVFTTHQSQEVRATGRMKVFGFRESDVDRMVVPSCTLDEEHLLKLLDGTVLIFKVDTASRQPLLELTLKKQ